MKFLLPLFFLVAVVTAREIPDVFIVNTPTKLRKSIEAISRRIPPFVESVERASPDVTFLAAHAYALKQAIDETIFLVKETEKLNMRETQEILVALESVKIEGHRGTEALGKPRDRIKELKLCGFMRTQIYQLQYKFRWLIPHLLDKFPKAAKGVGGTVRITLERFLEDWAKAYTLYNCKNDLYDTA